MNLSGMSGFMLVWAGQFFSRVASFMTSFALAIWAFDQTHMATTLTTISFLAWGSTIIASPFAGALVDRWNRKLTMIISDAGAVLSTLALLILYLTGNLQIWHLWVVAVIVGVGDAFQWPAFSAAISTMLKKEDYGRAYGLNGMAESASVIIAPPLAAAALAVISLDTIMLIDFATFVLAIGAVLIVTIPEAQVSTEGKAARSGKFRDELTFGFRYIFSRPTLLGLQLIILSYNMLNNLGGGRLTDPMVLARTGGDTVALGVVQMAFGLGGVVSGAALGAWGAFKNRPSGLFLGIFGQCTGYALIGIGRGPVVWALGAFLSMFSVSVALASSQAFWQSKVPPDIQGKVFATRKMIAQMAGPLSVLAAGPLADRVFEPAMASGAFANSLAWLVGTGPGAGMGLQLAIFGMGGALAGLCGFLFKATRDAERLLPDHTQATGEVVSEDASEMVGEVVAVPAG